MEDSLVHGYLACVSYMDAQVGKLLTTLEKKGVADRTIVVLLGDHGYKFGDFGSWCKDTHYDLDTHVPLIIHHPDLPAARTKSITELIDVYPTLVAATETKTAQDLSGISLLPLFDNPEKSLKKAAFSQRPRKKDKVYGYSVRTDDFRLVKWVDYAVPEKTVNLELYDYRNDPMELVNVANQMEYKVVQATLLEELQGTIER
ncbi:MAG: sulfatase-like hydrolase/transferase [Bacteroidota bacterium]